MFIENLGKVETYLIFAGVAGFIIYALNARSRKKTGKQSDTLLTFTALAGGTPGMLLAMLFFDRKAEKENMMIRITTICFFLLQTIAFLIYKGKVTEEHHFEFWRLFTEHRYLLYYIAAINLITLIVFGVDKYKAKKEKERIRITTLLFLSAAGGSPGGFIGMYLFRHKTQKNYFKVGLPLIIFTQLAVLIYLLNTPFLPALYS